jgi:hypothetical protein
MQFVVAERLADLTAAQLVSEEALTHIESAIATDLQAKFTDQARAQFEATFRNEIEKHSQSQGGSQMRIELWDLRLDGGFSKVDGQAWIDKFPEFANCEGKRLVTGVKGMFLRSFTGDAKAEADNSLVTAAQTALNAALGNGQWSANLQAKVGVEVQRVSSSRLERGLGAEEIYIPVWYRTDVVAAAPRFCASVDSVTVSVGDAQKDKAACAASLGPDRAPTHPNRAQGKLRWFVDSSRARLICQCDEAPNP